ncbi:unnamed protein product, partial [Prorocentrum cordatum]
GKWGKKPPPEFHDERRRIQAACRELLDETASSDWDGSLYIPCEVNGDRPVSARTYFGDVEQQYVVLRGTPSWAAVRSSSPQQTPRQDSPRRAPAEPRSPRPSSPAGAPRQEPLSARAPWDPRAPSRGDTARTCRSTSSSSPPPGRRWPQERIGPGDL